jgi:putative FmdB family regulatory protein
MPTYVYECGGCGHRFEEFQSMTAAVLKKCPACAKPKLQRLIGAGAGVIFKGSGFYQTDYKSKGGGEPAAKPETAGDGKKPATDADKPAATPAPAKKTGPADKK